MPGAQPSRQVRTTLACVATCITISNYARNICTHGVSTGTTQISTQGNNEENLDVGDTKDSGDEDVSSGVGDVFTSAPFCGRTWMDVGEQYAWGQGVGKPEVG